MAKNLIKSPSFIIGSLIIMLLFFLSIFYKIIFNDHIPQPGINIMYDKQGKLLKGVLTPKQHPPLGTDNQGRDIFFVMLVGAKYTIGTGFLVAFFRLFFSTIIGVFFSFYFSKWTKFATAIVESSNFFPATIFTYYLLQYILFYDFLFHDKFTYPLWIRIMINLMVLIVVAIPSTALLISNETRNIIKNEFIESAIVLGANKFHIVKTHIRPFLLPQLFIVFLREFIQVMLLIAHLGLLGIMVGGGQPGEDLFQRKIIVSISNEWSGLIGSWWSFLWTSYPWIPFIPICFFTLIIIAAKLTLEGFTQALSKNPSSSYLNIEKPTKNVMTNPIEKKDFVSIE
ncbi:peptide ABC transporter permease [Fictibacillus sp. Mic-4]|uniref:ABC transporter permease n=1 Tax=Fictibacillus sp. Mic-4 TaxID=3132826 RepID=UPI003CE7817A